MAKVDLSSQAWCDLVFSGKNKAYGAYKMRETSPRRHNIAVILVIVIALIGFSIPTLIKMATPKQKEVMTEVTTLSQLEEPEVKQEEMKRIEIRMERLDREKKEEISQMKIRFYVNISHELRTPSLLAAFKRKV